MNEKVLVEWETRTTALTRYVGLESQWNRARRELDNQYAEHLINSLKEAVGDLHEKYEFEGGNKEDLFALAEAIEHAVMMLAIRS
ncbi:hypothetical protein [Thiocapsa sp. N5-Cardenillas]|uniref:hypothetical protein n=1 Tax=Thiocapsa sp. N5-Cardenillas TaxID=3137397 RepID=UPI0035B05233